jgi:hypothetical protein
MTAPLLLLLLAQTAVPARVTTTGCAVVVSQVSPPTRDRGWTVQFTYQDGGEPQPLGQRVTAVPYEQKHTLPTGTFLVAGEWARGSAKVAIPPITYACGVTATPPASAPTAPTIPPPPTNPAPTVKPQPPIATQLPVFPCEPVWVPSTDWPHDGEWSACDMYGMPPEAPGWFQTRQENQTNCPKEPPTRTAWRTCEP